MEVIVLIVVVLIVVQVLMGQKSEKKISGRLRDCRFLGEPHKWSYNRNDKLECIDCGFVAGTEELPDETEE